MALLGREAAIRVDRDELRAAALRLLHAAPQVQVGNDGIRTPDEDQSRVLELLEVGADRGADGCNVARLACGRADRAVE